MRFSSLLFLLYFLPITWIACRLLRFSATAQNAALLAVSLLFYAWGDPRNLLPLLGIIALNYLLGRAASRAQQGLLSPRWVVAGIGAANILPLLFYTYLPPAAAGIADAFGRALPFAFPAAPLGIAIIALQGISYGMDIYRGRAEAEKSPLRCALFLSFFPTLFAGPILRYHEVEGQLRQREMTWSNLSEGFCRFIVGLGKYVLIAKPLAALAGAVIGVSNISGIFANLPAAAALTGFVAAILQLYYQLSSISDMAIGLGRMFGFHYPENFNYPLLATSVTDFWRRSYRSLTAWFEEYVFAPLQARSKNADRRMLYYFVMWMLIGLWIGPGLPNLIFALWSFIFLLMEFVVDFESSRLRRGLRRLYVVAAMSVGLLALRIDTLYEFALFMGNLFGARNNGFGAGSALALLREYWAPLALGIVFLFPIAPRLAAFAGTARGPGRWLVSAAYGAGMVALALLILAAILREGRDASLLTDFMIWSMQHG